MAAKLKKVKSLSELRQLASIDPRYAQLAQTAASNLGQPSGTLQVALRSLSNLADETSENGVMGEVNFVRDLVP